MTSPLKEPANSSFSNGARAELLEGRVLALQRENQALKEEMMRSKESQGPPMQGEWQSKYNNLYLLYRKMEQNNVDITNRSQKERNEYQAALHVARTEAQRAQQTLHQVTFENQMLQQRIDEQLGVIFTLQRQHPPPQYSSNLMPQTHTASVVPVSAFTQTDAPPTGDGPNVGRDRVSMSPQNEANVQQANVTKQTAKKKKADEDANKDAVISHLQRVVQERDEIIARLRGEAPNSCAVAIQVSRDTVSVTTQTVEQPGSPVASAAGGMRRASSQSHCEPSEPIIATVNSLLTSKPIQIKLVPQAHILQGQRWSDEPFDADLTTSEPLCIPPPLARQNSMSVNDTPPTPTRSGSLGNSSPAKISAEPPRNTSNNPRKPSNASSGSYGDRTGDNRRKQQGPNPNLGRWSGGAPDTHGDSRQHR
jgi:hypothetical protein